MKKNPTQNTKRKCNYERIQVTLDMCHNKQCTSFADNDTKVHQYNKEIQKLQDKINVYENKSFSNLNDDEIEAYHSLCQKKKKKKI